MGEDGQGEHWDWRMERGSGGMLVYTDKQLPTLRHNFM